MIKTFVAACRGVERTRWSTASPGTFGRFKSRQNQVREFLRISGSQVFEERDGLRAITDYEEIAVEMSLREGFFHQIGVGRIVLDQQHARSFSFHDLAAAR